jgi:hypothetical protein
MSFSIVTYQKSFKQNIFLNCESKVTFEAHCYTLNKIIKYEAALKKHSPLQSTLASLEITYSRICLVVTAPEDERKLHLSGENCMYPN